MIKFNLKKRVISALIIYFSLISLLFTFQRKLQYMPSGNIGSLSSYGLSDFSEQYLTTSDGVEVFSWNKLDTTKNCKVILYFHGNGGSLADRAYRFQTMVSNGYCIMALSYRGYKKSKGSPSEEGFLLDAQAALDFLYSKGFKNSDIIIYGESLGSGVAVQIAAKQDFYLLILESAYSSITSVARSSYWYVPLNLLLKDKFESIKYAPKVNTPILFFHGKKDRVVNYKEGQKLFAAVSSRKKFITDKQLGHVQFDPKIVLKELNIFRKELR